MRLKIPSTEEAKSAPEKGDSLIHIVMIRDNDCALPSSRDLTKSPIGSPQNPEVAASIASVGFITAPAVLQNAFIVAFMGAVAISRKPPACAESRSALAPAPPSTPPSRKLPLSSPSRQSS